MGLGREPVPRSGSAAFEALGEGLTFLTEPLGQDTEITGPASAKLFIASSTSDADIFLVLRVLDPDGQDVKFVSGIDPEGVVTIGWLRASHRKLDPEKSLPYRPWHAHGERWPLTPGETAELDVEIWPTSVIVPAGYRIGVSILGRDFEWPGDGPWPEFYPGVPMRGNGVFLHDDARDRPAELFAGTTTLVSGGDQPSSVLLPIIPDREKE
jgi:predicted acyl esterase